MANLSAIKIQKGFEALADMLREQILNGEILAGEALPNEKELAERSGLSRGSVREALRVLETQGLVSTRVGRNGGRIAVESSTDTVKVSLSHFIRGRQVPFPVLMETAEALEPTLAKLAAIHRNETDVKALKLASDKLRSTTSASRFLSANAAWHAVMAEASHNPILTPIYHTLAHGLLDPKVAGFASAEVRDAVVHAVTKVEAAIVAGDFEAARRRMERHVSAYRALAERVAPKIVTL